MSNYTHFAGELDSLPFDMNFNNVDACIESYGFESPDHQYNSLRCGVPTPTDVVDQSAAMEAHTFDKYLPDAFPYSAADDFGSSVLFDQPSFNYNNTVLQDIPVLGSNVGHSNFLGNYELQGRSQNQYPEMLLQQPRYMPFYMPPVQEEQIGTFYHTASGYQANQTNQTFAFGARDYTQSTEIPQENPWGTSRLRARPSPIVERSIAASNRNQMRHRRSPTNIPATPNSAPLSKRKNRRGIRIKRDYDAERPKKNSEKEWVRVNNTTKGKSTRTGKINNYDAKHDGGYRATTHPLASQAYPYGKWQSPDGQFDFKYHRTGELTRATYTVAEMKSFIYDHPTSEDSHLTLWIQKAPADSAARYNAKNSSCCRFANCPARDNNNWTITIGHMRVALDEQWATYGESRDPFSVAGFVHLYCLERFLDFADICKRFDVRSDDRDMPQEPRGYFGGALTTKGDGACYNIAHDFIKRCKTNTLADKYANYPAQSGESNGAPKSYDKTLCWALTREKVAAMCKSKRIMMEKRGLSASSILVHFGDVEMALSEGGKGKKVASTQNLRRTSTVPLIGPIPTNRKRKSRVVELHEENESDFDSRYDVRRCRVTVTPAPAQASDMRFRQQQGLQPMAPMAHMWPYPISPPIVETIIPIDPVLLGIDCLTPAKTPLKTPLHSSLFGDPESDGE